MNWIFYRAIFSVCWHILKAWLLLAIQTFASLWPAMFAGTLWLGLLTPHATSWYHSVGIWVSAYAVMNLVTRLEGWGPYDAIRYTHDPFDVEEEDDGTD